MTSTTTTAVKAGQEQITQYLDSNPDFLENYVCANVDLETIERWVIRKATHAHIKPSSVQVKEPRRASLGKWKFCVHADKRAMLQEMTYNVQKDKNRSTKAQILYELATCIKGAVDADAFNLYIVSETHGDIYKYVMANQRLTEEEMP